MLPLYVQLGYYVSTFLSRGAHPLAGCAGYPDGQSK